MENLFMQVFERRDWVTAQMRQQVDSHAQSLACTLLAAGHRPPPWLFPSYAGGLQELNGKPIVSEFLFPGSQITTPATNRTVFLPAAVPSTSFRNVGVPNRYTRVETVCPTLDISQHEEPQLKQISDNQDIAEAGGEVNTFSIVQRSRSRQRSIEDRLREKDQAANSGSSDGTQDKMQRSKLATVGSKRATASLSSKPCGDGVNNAGTTASLPGQENGFHANQGRSTESLKCSEDGDLGNQGVHLDCSQSLVLENQIVGSDNNVKIPNNCSVRNLIGEQVTYTGCHPIPVTHLSVEPKRLQFDGVESVYYVNPSSEQTMKQTESALESYTDLAEAHPLNEDPSSTSCSQVPCSMGRSLLDGVESGYLNPDSAPVKQQQQQKSASVCASLDLNGLHSQKEDPSLTSSSEVPNSMSGPLLVKDTRCISAINSVEGPCSKVSPPLEKEKLTSVEINCFERSCSAVSQLLERDALHTVEDTGRIRVLHCLSDRIVTRNSKSLEQQCSDSHVLHSHVLHSLYSRSLQLPTQLADTSSGPPASSGIMLDGLLEVDGCEDLSRSLINDVNSQCSQARSAACPEQLQPQTVTSGDVYQPSLSSYKTQNDDTHSNCCPPVVNASVSAENELLQEQYLLARPSLQFNGNFTDVDTPFGHPPPGTENDKLNGYPACDVVNCYSGKLGDIQIKFSAFTEACDISVRNKKNESAVPEVTSSISVRRTSEMYTTERNSMTSAEKCKGNLQQDGTEQDTSLSENAVQINANSCTVENDQRMKSSRPSVQYLLRSRALHEKINLLQSDRSSATCDQKRSIGDGVQINVGLSSKRRRIRCRSDVNLSRTPCANSSSLNHQVGITMLAAANFSEKSQPSGRYFLRSSGSCESMSLESEGMNAASNCKMLVASDVYGNGSSSRGRRNTTSLSNVVLHNSPNASSSRSAIEERVFENSQEQIQNNLEVEFLTTAASPSCSGILSDNEVNCTQEESTCLEGQDINVANASVADQEMALQMDNMSSRNVILNPENYSGIDSFTIFPSYALDQYGEQASAPNALVHGKLCYGSNVEFGKEYKSYDPNDLLSGAAISRQLGDASKCDDTMPEFESFDVPVQFDSPTIGQRTFEALYDSRQLVTFSSDPLKKHNINTVSGVHQLFTTMSGKPTNCSFPDDLHQHTASNDCSIVDTFGACGLGLDGSFSISDSVASCSSNASNRQEINKTPLTPSVEKYSIGKLPSRSGPGSDHMGSIPELECFRIDEDSSIAEEDKYQDKLSGSVYADYSHQWPSGRKALQDITGLCQNNANSASLSTRCMDKGNIDLAAETFSSELNHHSNIKNDHDINKPKENHSTSVKREGKVSRSLHDRLGSTGILDSRNGRHKSEANVNRRSKASNIVANVTSFIPLVKPKLQPTTACVKKDVKVKALKAAEAAKRLEEKKQKEQEMRKAAAKLERERLKQEKELKQKLEEEQKKKRDADAATKKRQREEVERRETARKRKCIDEARKQQKPPMDRRRTAKDEKDARGKASDNMELRKNLVDVGKNQVKPDGTTEPALGYKANKSNNEKGVTIDERPASFGSHAKENIPNSLEESYKMSPYKDSDEENDDDFEHEQESRHRRKIVPSWARKENLDKILLSNKTLDPREIFAQKCSFNISDVLSAHIPQRGFR